MAMRSYMQQSILSGTVSGLLMDLVIVLASRRQTGRSVSGLNAISHILWGRRAARQKHWSIRYTVSGALEPAGLPFLVRLFGSPLAGSANSSLLARRSSCHVYCFHRLRGGLPCCSKTLHARFRVAIPSRILSLALCRSSRFAMGWSPLA